MPRFDADIAMPYLRNNNVGTSTSKPQSSKNTRYVDKRLDEVYPARKPTSRFTVLVGKSSSKVIA